MTLAALGDSPHLKLLTVIFLVGVGFLVCYTVACAIWPFSACLHCTGSGKKRSPSGRAWRSCRRCAGTGAAVRLGRRIWTYLRRTHKRGNR